MSAIARPPYRPARLLWLFLSSMAASALVASAATMLIYVIQDKRESGDVAGVSYTPEGNIEAPPGLLVVLPVAGADDFEELTGFAPFIPEVLPSGTRPGVKLSVTQPDADGMRVGRVAFSATGEPGEGGITGPIVVLAQAKGSAEGIDTSLKRLTAGDGRALVATRGCGKLLVDVQLYFGPPPAAGEPYVTPYMTRVAEDFLDAMRLQCER